MKKKKKNQNVKCYFPKNSKTDWTVERHRIKIPTIGIIQLKEKGLGILITDHNVRETLRITERAYIMAEGNILISGTGEEIANNKTARKVYLGDNFKLD